MCLATSAYVAVQTINAAVNFTKGYYKTYAKYRGGWGDLIYLWEILVVGLWELWALVIIILSFLTADTIVKKTGARMKEAADGSIGLENALTWDVVFQTCAMMLVSTLGVVIAGISLGDLADELIDWINNYEDNVAQADDKIAGD